MRKSNLRATAGRQALALLGAGVFAAAPAAAQDTPETAPSSETQPSESQKPAVATDPVAQADTDDAIVVTGSRIARPDLEAPSPVTTVGSEQFDLTGTVTVETLLNELPQLIPGNTKTSNNQGGEDFSTLDLRGLGPQRTLILVDGERVPASSTSGVVDIGTIPAGLIERVDVVTGGASAVYGSDAMAGVVNFVLKDNFEGLELTSLYGISQHGDGAQFNVQGLLGGNFGDDRGNMTLFASYFTRESVGQGDRDVTRNGAVLYYDYNTSSYFVADHLTPPAAGQVLAAAAGSGTPPFGFISNNASNPFQNLSVVLPAQFAGANTDCNPATPGVNVNGGNLSFNDAGALTPRFTSGLCAFADRSVGSSRFNFNPLNYLVTPYNRLSIAATGRYDISDAIRFKIIANYTDSSQEVNLAPTPATGIVVPFNSPLIPADLAAALATRPNPTAPFTIDRRFSETGPRVGIYDSRTATVRGTLSGPLIESFNWDVTTSYGRTDAVASLRGNINRTALTQGLNGCPLGSLPGCVPVDIFGAGTVTGAALSFVNLDTKETREFEQARIAGNITGNLIELPAGPVGVAIGAEARTDRGKIIVDDAQRTGNIYGFNATQNQAGKVNVKEVYGEVRVPILADLPFVHELSVEAGARYSDYSTVGGLFNYKFGAQFSPVEWLKFRGIYNKAARAPSITELFQNGDQGFPSYTDFCNATPAGSRTAAELALCQAQAPAVNFATFAQNNTQVQAFAFGSPNLVEETAKTYTLGAVLTPNLGLGRFSATVDYYNIKITDLVTTLGAGFYLAACSASADPLSDACQRIARNQGTGQIDAINTSIANQGELKTSGVDAAVNFVVPFADLGIGLGGRFRFQELISWLDKYDFNGTDFAGTGGGGIGGTLPEWKSTMTVAYDSSDFTAQLRWNYQNKVQDISVCSVGTDCAPDIRALSNFDLALRKRIGNNFELTGNVQNLFNAKAYKSVAGYFAEGGTDVSYYTPVILGRYFQISGKVKM
jgi:outer membrane receptor protein involved in Fe transport